MPLTKLTALASLTPDAIDNSIIENRGKINELIDEVARVEGLIKPATPGGVVIITYTDAVLESKLLALLTGQVAILRGPTSDITLARP